MSETVSADRAADPRGGPDTVTQADGRRRRRWPIVLVVAVVAVVAAAVAGVALAAAFRGSGSPGRGDSGYGTSTACPMCSWCQSERCWLSPAEASRSR